MSPWGVPWKVVDLAGGLLWATTYVLVVRRGALDRTSGMPLAALAAAFSWEFIFAVLRPTPELPPFVVPVWLVIDTAIVTQYLRNGLSERCSARARAWFHATFAAALLGAFALEWSVVLDLRDPDGAYTGFAVNVVMSLAFLAMLERRRDVRGQSLYIALAKLLGSVIAMPHAYALHGSWRSLRVFMGATLILDILYAVRLHRQCRAQGIDPWRRV